MKNIAQKTLVICIGLFFMVVTGAGQCLPVSGEPLRSSSKRYRVDSSLATQRRISSDLQLSARAIQAISGGHQMLQKLTNIRTVLSWCEDFNAYATPNSEIVMGAGLYRAGMENSRGDETRTLDAMGYVLAHEYAHQWQFKHYGSKWMEEQPAPIVELQADLIGGYLLSRVITREQQMRLDSLGVAMISAASLGDNEFSSPDHHGTSEQRVLALSAGLEMGQRFSLSDFAKGGKAFADSLRVIDRILGNRSTS